MALVKCRFCGKYIDRKDAFKVVHGKTNYYYCCEEHSTMKSDKEIFNEKAFEILGKLTNTAYFKEMNEIADVHSYPKMISYLEENHDFLYKAMNDYSEKFKTEFGKIRYFSTILRNNLGDFTPSEKNDIPSINENFEEPTDFDNFKKEEVVGFEELLEELI